MTSEDIIRMAREAGASHDGPLFVPDAFTLRFAALVAKREREECAKVCEELDAWNEDDPGSSAAAAIRAREKE